MADKKTEEILNRIIEAKKKSRKETEEELKTLKEMDKTYRSIAGEYGASGYLRSLQNQMKTLESIKELNETELQAKVEISRIADQMLETAVEQGATEEQLVNIRKMAADLQKMSLDDAERELKARQAITTALQEELDKRKKLKKQKDDDEKREKKYERHLKSAESFWEGIAQKSGFFTTNLTGINRKIGKMAEDPEKMIAMFDAFRDRFNLANLFASLSESIIAATASLVKAADEATTAFAAATGVGSRFNATIVGVQRSSNLLGVTMQDSSDAIKELFQNAVNFVKLSPSLRNSFVEQTALLSKIGLSAKNSANMFNSLTLGLHMTEESAIQTTAEIATMGLEFGISADQMASDFESAMNTLMIYGPRAKQMFTDLSAAARASGVSVEKLLSMAKKFDTFKDSAKTVAGLNALLGTQLSTTQMLMMTEEDRVEHVIKTIQAQGTAFKDMDRFYKKSVAAQLDMSTAEAEKVLGMNLGQYEMYRKKMAETAKAQERIKEAVHDALPLAEQFVILFKELGQEVLPILQGLRSIMKGINEFVAGLNPETKRLIAGVVLLGGAMSALLLVVIPLGKTMLGLYSVITTGSLVAGGSVATATVTGGAMAVGFVATAKAIGILTLALVALAAAAGTVMLIWEGFSVASDWVSSLGPSMSEAAQAAEDMAALEAATTPKSAAVLENLALLKTGQAAQALTGEHIAATVNSIHSSVEAILPNEMVLVIDAGSRTTLNAYIDARAAGIASGRITSPIQSARPFGGGK
jgi:hypothetical protein